MTAFRLGLPLGTLAVWLGSRGVPAEAGETRVVDPASLSRAIERARPGDSIVMADRTWRDLDLVFAARGEPRRPITLRAETPGKVIVTGSSRLRIGGQDLVVSGLYFRDGTVESGSVVEFRRDSTDAATRCRLTDCAILDDNPADKTVDTKWVSLHGRKNRVDHCEFAG